MAEFLVFIFLDLMSDVAVPADGSPLIVWASCEMSAAGLGLLLVGCFGPVDAVNVVPVGSDLDVLGVVFFDCSVSADGLFSYGLLLCDV